MATVNFSVPDHVKRRFDRAFRGRNKSAVIARLMEQAVEDEQRRERRVRAVDALLTLRTRVRPVRAAEARRARLTGRP